MGTIRPEDRLSYAAEMMEVRDCGCIAVVDADGHIVGVITDRDVCLKAHRTDAPLSKLDVRGAMSERVHACHADDSIEKAENVMGQHQVRRLPVVDAEGRLCGILSLDDIAREACREEDWIAPPVSAEAVGRTLGQIGRPHLIVDVDTGGGGS
ncbi:MAG: CBS domain-containing protein [bacterium]|nr:CBS domain-containing protein [bacterium]